MILNGRAKRPIEKNSVEPGIVYIAGAGPGDPGLLTVKTAHLLAIADVIIYDRLVNSELLNLCRADATLIYAGKKKGRQGSQSKINELML